MWGSSPNTPWGSDLRVRRSASWINTRKDIKFTQEAPCHTERVEVTTQIFKKQRKYWISETGDVLRAAFGFLYDEQVEVVVMNTNTDGECERTPDSKCRIPVTQEGHRQERRY